MVHPFLDHPDIMDFADKNHVVIWNAISMVEKKSTMINCFDENNMSDGTISS